MLGVVLPGATGRHQTLNIFELTALESMLRPHNKELLPQYLVAKEQNGGWKCGIAAVDDLLSETYGLILYQEQVMRIAALVGNYSPHGTLSFMRTLFHGAEDDLWADCREEFIASATNNGYDVQKVQKLWERMEQFGSYILINPMPYALPLFRTITSI